MQIVIDIHEKDYKSVLNRRYVSSGVVHAIMNGTPLPKGHGRLIDADAVMSDINNSIDKMTDIGIIVDGQWLWEKLNDAIYNAKPIIEADKESEE